MGLSIWSNCSPSMCLLWICSFQVLKGCRDAGMPACPEPAFCAEKHWVWASIWNDLFQSQDALPQSWESQKKRESWDILPNTFQVQGWFGRHCMFLQFKSRIKHNRKHQLYIHQGTRLLSCLLPIPPQKVNVSSRSWLSCVNYVHVAIVIALNNVTSTQVTIVTVSLVFGTRLNANSWLPEDLARYAPSLRLRKLKAAFIVGQTMSNVWLAGLSASLVFSLVSVCHRVSVTLGMVWLHIWMARSRVYISVCDRAPKSYTIVRSPRVSANAGSGVEKGQPKAWICFGKLVSHSSLSAPDCDITSVLTVESSGLIQLAVLHAFAFTNPVGWCPAETWCVPGNQKETVTDDWFTALIPDHHVLMKDCIGCIARGRNLGELDPLLCWSKDCTSPPGPAMKPCRVKSNSIQKCCLHIFEACPSITGSSCIPSWSIPDMKRSSSIWSLLLGVAPCLTKQLPIPVCA